MIELKSATLPCWLSLLYAHSPKTQSQAIASATRATELGRRQIACVVNLGHLIWNNHREAEASSLAEKVRKAAHTVPEQEIAQGLLEQMRDHQAGRDRSNP